MPMSHATQPGQSLYAIFSAGPVGTSAGAAGAALAAAAGASSFGASVGSLLQAKIESERTKPKSTRRRVFMRVPRESPRFGPRLLPERVVVMSPETIRESPQPPHVSSPFRGDTRVSDAPFQKKS